MINKQVVLRVGLALLVLNAIIAAVILMPKVAAVKSFDGDPTCAKAQLQTGRPSEANGACTREAIRIARTWSSQVGKGAHAYNVVFSDATGASYDVAIAPEDGVFWQMLHAGDGTEAVFNAQRPVWIAYRQYWLETEDNPHRAVFKTALVLSIEAGMLAILLGILYCRVPA